MLYQTQVPGCDDQSLRQALRDFVMQPKAYKQDYLQEKLAKFQEGYSYWGQQDSTNQNARDMLHSFVISEFVPTEKFPKEFHDFFSNDWEPLQAAVRRTERNFIEKLEIPGLAELYEDTMGHMVSCNYYPPVGDRTDTSIDNTRLMRHTDISLFSTFVFGIDKGFAYVDEKDDLVELGHQTQIICFTGYLLELLTDGAIPALKHQVVLPDDRQKERFSFAFFSIPKQQAQLNLGNVSISADQYLQKYLSMYP